MFKKKITVTINADEAIAKGACFWGAAKLKLLPKEWEELKMTDILTQSYGIKCVNE